MKVEMLLKIATDAFQQKFREVCPPEAHLPELTVDSFSRVTQILKESLSASGTAGLKAYLEANDEKDSVLDTSGGKVRFKMGSEKEYLTVFGWVRIHRRLYQSDTGEVSYIPLDEKLDMRGESLTPVVREAVHFASCHNTPGEVEALLAKCALFNPSRTAALHANEGFGTYWKQHGEVILAKVREKERVHPETKAMVVSLDGVNVLMREAGRKRGRKNWKPMKNPSEETPTSYHNAMVGSVSLYRLPQGDEKGPQRLSSRYVSRMPEENFLSFRQAFEPEVSSTILKLPPRCHKILILDGSRALWKYVKGCPLFKRHLVLVDYYHATEYLAKAAEAAYGTDKYESQGWFRRWKENLLKMPGAARKIIRAMSYLLKVSGAKGERKRRILSARRYFVNNWKRMNYAWFHKRGLPVGSGVVEAACKSIVKSRMCRSGMRWTKEGGQTILSLRTIVKSNRWDPCWQEYQKMRMAA